MRGIDFHIHLIKYRIKMINYYYVSKCQSDSSKICLRHKMRAKILGYVIQHSVTLTFDVARCHLIFRIVADE